MKSGRRRAGSGLLFELNRVSTRLMERRCSRGASPGGHRLFPRGDSVIRPMAELRLRRYFASRVRELSMDCEQEPTSPPPEARRPGCYGVPTDAGPPRCISPRRHVPSRRGHCGLGFAARGSRPFFSPPCGPGPIPDVSGLGPHYAELSAMRQTRPGWSCATSRA